MKSVKTSYLFKTEWDFSEEYSGINDPKIEKELKSDIALIVRFAKKYKDKKFIKNNTALLVALKDWEKIETTITWKPLYFLHLLKTVESGNTELEARFTKWNQTATEALKEIIFFGNAIGKIDQKRQASILKDKKFVRYAYQLEIWFQIGKHTLTDSEEKILADKELVAHEAWVSMQDRYENAQMIKYGKKMIPLSEAMSLKADLPRPRRRALHKACMEKYRDISFVAEAELNAIIQNKISTDKLRGFTKPYESTVLEYQNDLKSIENLVETVTSTNDIAQDFYALKAKIINKIDKSSDTKITAAETNTAISTNKKRINIPLEKAIETVRTAFMVAGPEFSERLDAYIKEGRFDFFPRKGKQSGGFCSFAPGITTRILMNYTGKQHDVETLAHEMGHAIHGDMSKTQPVMYEGCTISVAEVASTFFENILFNHMLDQASIIDRFDMLTTNVQQRISTIHRQIAFFQFEKKLHAAVKEKGYVSKEDMARMYIDIQKTVFGQSVDLVENDGYGYVYISHFRSFFYVYAYAYGQLIADALFAEYKKDKKFIEKVKVFLSAGMSMSPADIFKKIGIDMTKPDFFKKGLERLREDLEEVKKLAVKIGKI